MVQLHALISQNQPSRGVNSKKRMPAVQRISIIQVRGGHDECVTPLVYTLNQIGVQCDVYINHGLLTSRGNIFEALHIKADEFIVTGKFRINDLPPEPIGNRIFWLDCNGQKQRQLLQKNTKKTLPIIFWTTFNEPTPLFVFCHDLGLKIYGFIHNSHIRVRYTNLFAYKNTKAVTFCRGMQTVLTEFNTQLINFYLPPMSGLKRTDQQNFERSNKIRIAVPGKVNYEHRDYDLLVKFASELETKFPAQFEFVIAGGLAGDDGTRLINSIKSEGLEQTVLLPTGNDPNQPKFMKYQELFDLLQTCDLALENSTSVKDDNSKISGAVNLCINFELPTLYLKGFSMYEEYSHLGNLLPEDLFAIANDKSYKLIRQKKEQAILLKLLMEEQNRNCLQHEVAQILQEQIKMQS